MGLFFPLSDICIVQDSCQESLDAILNSLKGERAKNLKLYGGFPKGVTRISGGWGTGYFKELFPEKIIQSKEVVSSDFANFDIFCS